MMSTNSKHHIVWWHHLFETLLSFIYHFTFFRQFLWPWKICIYQFWLVYTFIFSVTATYTEMAVIRGYNKLSLIRASAVLKCQSTFAAAVLPSISHADNLPRRLLISSIHRNKHCRGITLSSISTIFLLLPHCRGLPAKAFPPTPAYKDHGKWLAHSCYSHNITKWRHYTAPIFWSKNHLTFYESLFKTL